MTPADIVRVKICGLGRREDAEAADALGADYVGVVLTSGFRRSVESGRAGALVQGLAAAPVAVLVDETPDRAARAAEALGAAVIQLHGEEPPGAVERLRALGPWRIWKSVRAQGARDVEAAVERYGSLIDGLLVEGFRSGVVGGGGAVLEAASVRDLRTLVPHDLQRILAGGLTPGTVAAAVDRFAPDVVDVSSGVEVVPGRKDPDLLRRFVEAARAAAGPTGPRTHSGADA